MRNRFLSLGVVLAALGIFPAAAQAHHVANQQATCDLVANVPTITASADFVEFGSPDQNVHITVGVDSAVPVDQHLPYAPAGGHWSASTPSAAGDHKVFIYITWTHYGTPNDSSFGPTIVTCPAPVPPPPTCNGVPMPPGTDCAPPPPVVYCNGTAMPPGTPASACAPPPKKVTPPCACKPRPHCIPRHARLKVFPLRRRHGEVIFTLAGVRRADVVSVRWAVHRPGQRWRHVGHSGKPWEHLAHRGLSWHIFLWVEPVWGYPQWGRHVVKATAKIKTTCGVITVVRRVPYMNHDPEPRAHAWS